VRSIIWLVDASFPVRQPGYCAAMRERFGDAAIRVTENHAKFVLVGNEQWTVTLRTSMNLNENRRLESWEVSDDRELYHYLREVVDGIFATEASEQWGRSRSQNRDAFDAETAANSPRRTRLRYIK